MGMEWFTYMHMETQYIIGISGGSRIFKRGFLKVGVAE